MHQWHLYRKRFYGLPPVASLFCCSQAFRLGYLSGSYRQTTGCMRSLVALLTPLGGEICALIRARNPEHPYLK